MMAQGHILQNLVGCVATKAASVKSAADSCFRPGGGGQSMRERSVDQEASYVRGTLGLRWLLP